MSDSGFDSKADCELSVIVTVVDGGETLERCLRALAAQADSPRLEVIVPYDDTIPEVAALAAEFPGFRFLSLGTIEAAGDSRNPYWEHVRYDCRRSGGLRAAQGALLAMVEDRGAPRPDWARTMVRLHAAHHHGAIGGAVECRSPGAWGRAVFVCDFGRYEPPLSVDDPEFLSDINICYKRAALESVRELWQERYQEASVNWALRARGAGLLLSSEAVVVQQRDRLELARLLAERLHWGRTFGQVRVEGSAPWKALLYSAALPLLPPLLFVRHLRAEHRKGRTLPQLVELSPALLLLLNAWSFGECVGYLEGAVSGKPSAPYGLERPRSSGGS